MLQRIGASRLVAVVIGLIVFAGLVFWWLRPTPAPPDTATNSATTTRDRQP